MRQAGGGKWAFDNGSKKYRQDRMPFPCGKCINCQINNARLWTNRIMLEAMGYEFNSFVTLTYNDDFLPCNSELFPRDVTLFFKRLRFNTGEKIRYFYCGEYGSKNLRPHYHIALFGWPENATEEIEKAWSFEEVSMGNVLVGDLNKNSARYISGYIVKGEIVKNERYHEKYLKGKHKEFRRMSRKPGLGHDTIKRFAERFKSKSDQRFYKFKQGKKEVYLGKYLQQVSDKVNDFDSDNSFNDYCELVYNLYYENGENYLDDFVRGTSQKGLQQEKRYKIFNKKVRDVHD